MAMKNLILIIILIFSLTLEYPLKAQYSDANISSEDVNAESEPPHHTPFPEGSKGDKSLNNMIQSDSKRRIEDLPVTYMVYPNDSKLRPAYVRYQMGFKFDCIYYVWKGVKVDRKDIPGTDGPFHSLSVTDVSRFPKTRIYGVVPPCYYYQLAGSNKYAVGYLDRHEGIFYEWRGVELNESQIPKDDIPDRIVCLYPAPPSFDGKEISAIVLIDPPQ